MTKTAGDIDRPVLTANDRPAPANADRGLVRDATSDIAPAVAQRDVDTDVEASAALQAFIAENLTEGVRSRTRDQPATLIHVKRWR